MEQYIYGVKNNIHVVNLEETEKMLKEACDFLYSKAKEGKQIVFVGTKRQAREIIEAEAKRSGAKYVTDRWLGGTMTNFKMIKKNMDKLVDMMKKRETNGFVDYTKKERLLIDREIEKLQRSVGGLIGLRDIPDVLFIVDAKKEKTSVREAKVANVQTVALIDTNTNPDIVDYPIPGNDDAIKSIALIVKTVADAVEQGYKDYDAGRNTTVSKEVKVDEAKEDEEELKVVLITSDDENIILDDTAVHKDDVAPIIEEDKK